MTRKSLRRVRCQSGNGFCISAHTWICCRVKLRRSDPEPVAGLHGCSHFGQHDGYNSVLVVNENTSFNDTVDRTITPLSFTFTTGPGAFTAPFVQPFFVTGSLAGNVIDIGSQRTGLAVSTNYLPASGGPLSFVLPANTPLFFGFFSGSSSGGAPIAFDLPPVSDTWLTGGGPAGQGGTSVGAAVTQGTDLWSLNYGDRRYGAQVTFNAT